jgi:hypothetical protein
MKTIEELEEFYYKNLETTLNELEDKRGQAIARLFKKWVICTIISVFLGFFIFVFFILERRLDPSFIYFFLGFYFIVMQGIYRTAKSKYNNNFKDSIITPLIKSIDDSLVYYKYKKISLETFTKSELFKKPDFLAGDDYVCGEIDGVKIEFSDVSAQKESRRKDNEVTYKSFFRGLFIKANFNKSFQGKTFVFPDSAESAFGSFIGNWLQSKSSSKGELVKMDNDEFEKEFVVYSSDQIEARYILTPSMMERLLDFKKKSGFPLYISFIDDKIHLAIANNKNNFEASLFDSLLTYGVAIEYIINIHVASAIVHDLKLNEKLWGKK